MDWLSGIKPNIMNNQYSSNGPMKRILFIFVYIFKVVDIYTFQLKYIMNSQDWTLDAVVGVREAIFVT